MNDYDLSLIAQLADGTIDAADEPAARALLESSDEARGEYETQLFAMAALRGAGPARLSPAERSALRESLISQLGLETEPAPAPVRRRWAVPWGGLAVAAAALVGVIALAPLLSLLSTDGGDSASDTIAGALEAPAADAPAATAAPGDLMMEERSTLDDDAGAPRAAVATTVASATAASPAGLYGDGLPYLGTIEADELPLLESSLQDLAVPDAAAWRLSLAGRIGADTAEPPLLDRFFARDGCAGAVPPGFSGEAVALAEVSGVMVIVYRIEPAAGSTGPLLLLVELDTCAEVAGSAGS